MSVAYNGVPRPVTASHPGVAGKPEGHASFLLLPLDMSVPTPPAILYKAGFCKAAKTHKVYVTKQARNKKQRKPNRSEKQQQQHNI
jgi:hypothetical protein